jgi:condensin-2 complex subunit H2
LEDYLQELAGLSGGDGPVHGDPANPQGVEHSNADDIPNFAHAALILQNSSHIYSRKVEYLHSLVYKALQDFFQSTAAAVASKKNSFKRSVDADIEEFFEFDPHENFLLLDDMVPEDVTHSKINLKDEDEDDDEGVVGRNTPNTSRRDRSSSGTNRNNTTRLSLGGLSVTRLERSALGGGFSSAVSQQQQRALLGILNNGTLRLVDGQCDVDDSGVLLMPGSQTGRSSLVFDGSSTTPKMDDEFAPGNPRNLFNAEHENEDVGFDAAADFGDYDDDDNDGPGFVMNDEGTDNVSGSAEPVTVPLASAGGDKNKRVTFAETTQNQSTEKPKKQDPWALLDPHSTGESYHPKPLKKGKTYKLPDGVTEPPSECVTGARTSRITHPKAQSLKQPTLRPSIAVETFRIANGQQLEPEFEITNFGLAYGDEFLYIAKENANLKAAKRRAERKKENKASGEGSQSAENQERNFTHDENDDDDNDFGGGFDFGGGEDDYDDDVDNNTGNAGIQSMDNLFHENNGDSCEGTLETHKLVQGTLMLSFFSHKFFLC